MADPTIRLGSTGAAVKKAQRQLIQRYYLPPGADDGSFDTLARNRVMRYQLDRAEGELQAHSAVLSPDGVVGPRTWARLAPATTREGDSGARVRLLQEILKELRHPPYDPGQVDGDFGVTTAAAVRSFQQDSVDFDGNPLVVDGIVGPRTWSVLGS